MVSNNEQRYLNFPIQLLQNFLIDTDRCLYNILAYGVYSHSQKLEFGEETDLLWDSLFYFQIEVDHDEELFRHGEKLFYSLPEKCPKVGLNTSIFNQFYGRQKDEFEKVCLLAFLSLKSIIGTKPFIKTNNRIWLSRMDGNPKSIDMNELSDEVRKYSSKYQARKIKEELSMKWGLKTYSRTNRGFYISFKMSKNDLVYQAEKKRKQYALKRIKEEEKLAIKMAKDRLSA